MDVSIVIVNYNTKEITKNCIASVIEHTKEISYEIIVVDNNSTDGSRELFCKDTQLIYLFYEQNLGFGKANNEGMKIAKGRNIFCLNSDTILNQNSIKILSDYLDENQNIGIIGGNLFSPDGCLQHSFGHFPSILTELNHLFKGKLSIFFSKLKYDYNNKNCPIKVDYICGADMMLPRKVIDKVGMFDPDFFMYYEDMELAFRVNKAGYKVMCHPDSKIIHLDGFSFKSDERRRDLIRNSRDIFLKKSYSKLYVFVLTFASKLKKYVYIKSL